jgi:hypothetical protein
MFRQWCVHDERQTRSQFLLRCFFHRLWIVIITGTGIPAGFAAGTGTGTDILTRRPVINP